MEFLRESRNMGRLEYLHRNILANVTVPFPTLSESHCSFHTMSFIFRAPRPSGDMSVHESNQNGPQQESNTHQSRASAKQLSAKQDEHFSTVVSCSGMHLTWLPSRLQLMSYFPMALSKPMICPLVLVSGLFLGELPKEKHYYNSAIKYI